MRYYEPTLGRFITQDPIGLMGGMNLYMFGLDSINWSDPLGLRGTAIRPNYNRRGTIQALSNNRYGSIRNNPDAIISRTRDQRYASSFPTGSIGSLPIPVDLVRDETAANAMEYIAGETKDWLMKMHGITGREVEIGSQRILNTNAPSNKCNKPTETKNIMYECHIYEETRCSLLNTLSGKLCFNETITHSTTKHHLVSPGTIVECKEIK